MSFNILRYRSFLKANEKFEGRGNSLVSPTSYLTFGYTDALHVRFAFTLSRLEDGNLREGAVGITVTSCKERERSVVKCILIVFRVFIKQWNTGHKVFE